MIRVAKIIAGKIGTFSGYLGLASVLALATVPGEITKAGIAVADNVLALLHSRSPGARAGGALSDTKFARRASALAVRSPAGGRAPTVITPSSFAAPVAAPELAPPLAYFARIAPVEPAVQSGLSDGTEPISDRPGALPQGPRFVIGGDTPAPLIAPPVVSPGGGSPGMENPTIETPPTAAAVPEPATWVTLILGFGFMGLFLRRRSADLRGAKSVGWA